MELEFHQLRMQYSGLRISLPGYEGRLIASLASEGQLHQFWWLRGCREAGSRPGTC